MTALEDRLLRAHAEGDLAALVGLYTEAAGQAAQPDAAAFFLTQAYVYALDRGDPRAGALHARLKAEGRES